MAKVAYILLLTFSSENASPNPHIGQQKSFWKYFSIYLGNLYLHDERFLKPINWNGIYIFPQCWRNYIWLDGEILKFNSGISLILKYFMNKMKFNQTRPAN